MALALDEATNHEISRQTDSYKKDNNGESGEFGLSAEC